MDTFTEHDASFDGRLYWLREGLPLDRDVCLLGVVFARPEMPSVDKEILASLRYYDARSSANIWFLFAGYVAKTDLNHVAEDGETGFWFTSHGISPIRRSSFIRVCKDIDWYFGAEEFNSVREDFQNASNWRYGGGVEILFINSRRDNVEDWVFDFTSSLVVRLDNLKETRIADSVGCLFEKIFQYSENPNASDPVSGLSNFLGLHATGTSFRRVFLSLFPKHIGTELLTISHFAVRDLTKPV